MDTNRESTNGEYCHTIYTLHLFVDSIYHYRDTIEICSESLKELTHTWADGYKQSYVTPEKDTIIHYLDNITTAKYHFDSIYDLRVLFHRIYTTHLSADICQGDSVQFGFESSGEPRWIKDKGIYRDTFVNTLNGCDSIVELKINWRQSYYSEIQKDITDKELPYIWYHIQGEDTIHIDSLYTACDTSYTFQDKEYGCDSITHLTLRIHKTYHFTDSITLCQSETPYSWVDAAGNVVKEDIYESGTYFQYLLTKDGYDSIYERHITIYPIMRDTLTHYLCQGQLGDSYDFNGRILTEPNTYIDTLQGTHGCDSIVVLHLLSAPSYHNIINKELMEGESFEYNGEIYNTPGEHRIFEHTACGCDSITIINIIFIKTFDDSVSVCRKDLPYLWTLHEGTPNEITHKLYNEGIYRDTITDESQHFYSSIKLSIIEDTRVNIQATICANESYEFYGKTLTQGGRYVDTLTAINGCDSIVSLDLMVLPTYKDTLPIREIMEGDSTLYNGVWYKEEGLYTFNESTMYGCDSIVVLPIRVIKRHVDSVTVCQAELPYIWHFNDLAEPYDSIGIGQAGRYDTTFIYNDRIVHRGLILTVLQSATATIRETICGNETYNFFGTTLSTGGRYIDTISATNGCDSIVTLELSVLTTDTITTYAETADNIPYEWVRTIEGIEKTSTHKYTGIYMDTIPHANSTCDSVILVLNLTVYPTYFKNETITICSNELPYTWNDRVFSSAVQDSTIKYQTIHGYDSIIRFTLIVKEPIYRLDTVKISLCHGMPFTYLEKTYSVPGLYRPALYLRGE